MNVVADDDTSDIEQQLDKLENDLMDAIATKASGQNTIEFYHQSVADLNSCFENMGKKIDDIDTGSGLNCTQKLDAIALIQNECEVQGLQKLDHLKQDAHKVREIINNLDAEQVEEKLKSTDRKYNDMIKRIARKAQMIGATNKGIQSLQAEIDQLNNWLVNQIAKLQEPQTLSFNSSLLNVHLQKLKAISKDADVKQVLADTLERRIANMQQDLEPLEKSQFENDLRDLGYKQKKLIDALAAEIDVASNALQQLKTFEADVDKFKTWLRTKFAEIKKQPTTIPILSKTVENEIQTVKSIEAEIVKCGTELLNEIKKQGQNISKNLSDKKPLETLLEKLCDEFDGLINESVTIRKNLTKAFEERRLLENDISKLEDWLSEIDICTQDDIQMKRLPILEEKLMEFESLKKQREAMRPLLNSLNERSKIILSTLNNVDKMKLNEQLKTLKDKFNKPKITERIKIIEDQITKYNNSAEKLTHCIDILNIIQQDIEDLKKPIGIDVEDVKALINTSERILRDLNDNKSKVNAIQIEDLPELSSTLIKHDESLSVVEKHISNLIQAQAFREQYFTLIEQIYTMIGTYGIQIADIDKSSKAIEEKLNQYDEMIGKIQECEGIFASVQDKGQKIAAEGTIADGNKISENNKKMKQKLQNLYQQVKNQRQKHENSIAEHNKLSSELSALLLWLHENEAICKSRPLLERDPDSVEHETSKHDIFTKEVQVYLDQVQKVDEQTDIDSGIPMSIVNLLSEGRSLIVNLPKELSDRRKYLTDSKQKRINYIKYVNDFKDWIHQAEGCFENCKHGIDFKNIVSSLDKLNSLFENYRPIKELVTQTIQSTVDQIWPTLQKIEQNELSEEVRQHKKLLEKSLNLAKQQRAQFEKYQNDWDSYRQMYGALRKITNDVQIEQDAADCLLDIQNNLRKQTNILLDLKVSILQSKNFPN